MALVQYFYLAKVIETIFHLYVPVVDMLELLLASNEIDLIHFDGDPTLEIPIQECQLVSSVAQAKPNE